MSSFDLNLLMVRNEERFLSNPVGDEVIILNMESGDYLGLNNVGAQIWELLKAPVNAHQIIDQLMQEFEVDAETCKVQTLEYLDRMKSFGLLEEVK
jgi:hypothetical protein